MNCRNCSSVITQKYCPECGQPAIIKRIDGKYIIHEIEHVLHFERGILYTIKELITNPGQNIKNYLSENRTRLVKPIVFIIITSLIYSLCNYFFHIQDGYINYLDQQKTTASIMFKWVQSNLGYSNILMGIFIAIWIKLFFKKSNYNIYEILILLCFVMGIGMLIYSIVGIIQGITQINLKYIADILGMIYVTWAIGHFYNKTLKITYLKAFIAYLFGMISFSILIIITGAIIDMLIKQ